MIRKIKTSITVTYSHYTSCAFCKTLGFIFKIQKRPVTGLPGPNIVWGILQGTDYFKASSCCECSWLEGVPGKVLISLKEQNLFYHILIVLFRGRVPAYHKRTLELNPPCQHTESLWCFTVTTNVNQTKPPS